MDEGLRMAEEVAAIPVTQGCDPYQQLARCLCLLSKQG